MPDEQIIKVTGFFVPNSEEFEMGNLQRDFYFVKDNIFSLIEPIRFSQEDDVYLLRINDEKGRREPDCPIKRTFRPSRPSVGLAGGSRHR